MLLRMVINPWEWVFRNRKHCCFCVCSLRVHVRMSAASGGKFCVNIFCFRDPPPRPLPSHCVVFIFCLFPKRSLCCSRFKYNNTSSLFIRATLLVIWVLSNRETFFNFSFGVICILQIYQQQYDIRSALISSGCSAKILVGDNDAEQRFIWFCALPCRKSESLKSLDLANHLVQRDCHHIQTLTIQLILVDSINF